MPLGRRQVTGALEKTGSTSSLLLSQPFPHQAGEIPTPHQPAHLWAWEWGTGTKNQPHPLYLKQG